MPARFEPAPWSPLDELAVRDTTADSTTLIHEVLKCRSTRAPRLTSPKPPFCSFAALLVRRWPSAARSSSRWSTRWVCRARGRHGLRTRRPIHDPDPFPASLRASRRCSPTLCASAQATSSPVSTRRRRQGPSPAWGSLVPVPVAHGALCACLHDMPPTSVVLRRIAVGVPVGGVQLSMLSVYMFFITFTCPAPAPGGRWAPPATLPRDRRRPWARRGTVAAAPRRAKVDRTRHLPLKKTWIMMANACTLQLMRMGTRSSAHGAASGRSRTAPRPHLHGTDWARITPIRRRNAPR